MQLAQLMNVPAFACWTRAMAILMLHAEQRPS
jgi:hypothetical protein